MKFTILAIFLLIGTIAYSQKSDLTIKITDVENSNGKIQIGLYNTEKGFLDESKQYKKVRITASAPTTTYTFRGLPDGTYAIAIYHDENNDSECNRNLIGIPTEEFGFSNNVRPVVSAPSFKSAKFSLTEDKTLTIKIDN